jgi:predicted permease
MLASIGLDVRYALRNLRQRPGFTVVALITLVLGIGANTATFSVANTVLFRPLNVPTEDRLVRVTSAAANLSSTAATLPHFNILREEMGPFDAIAAHRLDFLNFSGDRTPEQIPVARVTEGFFRVFGASLLAGRQFTDDDDRPGASRVAVLSRAFWLSRFAGANDAIGHRVTLGGQSYLVIGILDRFDPEQFDQPPGVWIPFQIDPQTRDVGGEFCFLTGRLKPGITREQAVAELSTAAADYARRFPSRTAPQLGFVVMPIRDAVVGNIRASLLTLLAAVGLVLLIACANIANLLLMRGAARTREIAIRAAMGANRSRILRQLLTESIVLAFAGGALGLVVGMVGAWALLTLYPGANPFVLASTGLKIPRVGDHGIAVTVDWRVIAFTLAASLLTAIVFGILPALQASRPDVSRALKEDGLSTSPTPRQHRSRSVLVAAEIALALALMVGAALLIRSSLALRAVNPGFDLHDVLTLRMSIADTPFQTRAGIERLTRDAVAQVRAIPGVIAASTTCCVPFETVWQLPFRMDDGRSPSALAGWTFVSPGYFDVLGIPLIRGRDFTDQDDQASPGVVIINEAMARRYWPDRDPLQDSILVGRGVRPDYENDPIRRVIGIVGNVRDNGLNRRPRAAMYVPVAQVPDGVTALNVRLLPLTWVVRTQGSVDRQVEAALQTASAGLPLARPRYLDEVARDSMARERFDTSLMSIFGLIGLLLSAVGIYGLMAYAVEQQIPELSIRLALGANPSRLGGIVALRGLRLSLYGIAVGAVGAWNLTHFLSALLFVVTPHDAVAFSIVPALLAAVAAAAVLIPAYRASRIDPITALRRS